MLSSKTVELVKCTDFLSAEFDALVLILDKVQNLNGDVSVFGPFLKDYLEIDKRFSVGVHVISCNLLPSKRLIISFTGSLTRDYDDVRRIVEASRDGILRAVNVGSVKPLLVMTPLKSLAKLKVPWGRSYPLCLSAILGALYAVYVPLEVREFAQRPKSSNPKSVKSYKVESLGWFTGCFADLDHDKLLHTAWCLEEGRRVARDIGGSDPERMAAGRVVECIQAELPPCSGVHVQSDPIDEKLYPLMAVVDRGSSDRHRGYVVHLEYPGESGDQPVVAADSDEGSDNGDVHLFLIGKGIVYDTGGSDLKVGGIMATMHRDKCGAAAVVGFFKVLSLLRPAKLKVHGSLAIVRNSIGPDAYVSDEIVISRAGARVRVTHTDAEGRMVMADLLCEAKERALKVPNPHLMTIATLTRHIVLTVGPQYTGIMCNGPARREKADKLFQECGSLLGEMSEISVIRREDFEVHTAREDYADLWNSAPPIDGKFCRGHQSPPAFMMAASRLDQHMSCSDHPLAYTHFDIAGSQGPCPGKPSGVPVLTLAARYLLPDLRQAV